jgi:hypothetical protein
MCRRAGYCRHDVPACRLAGWFRDWIVIPDGLVRNRRQGRGSRALEHCYTATLAGFGCGWLAGRAVARQIRTASRIIAAANGSMYKTTMAPPED